MLVAIDSGWIRLYGKMTIALELGRRIGRRGHVTLLWRQFARKVDITLVIVVVAYMARLDQGDFDIKAMHFVQHTFDEPFDGIFSGTVAGQPGNAERARGGAEDEVAAGDFVCTEIG